MTEQNLPAEFESWSSAYWHVICPDCHCLLPASEEHIEAHRENCHAQD